MIDSFSLLSILSSIFADNKTSFNANDWVLASRYSEAIATIQKWTNEYETKFGNLADEVKKQKDQSIIVWYLEYEPTLKNLPASGCFLILKPIHIVPVLLGIIPDNKKHLLWLHRHIEVVVLHKYEPVVCKNQGFVCPD